MNLANAVDRRQQVLARLYALLENMTIPLAGGQNGAVSINPGNIVLNRNELPASLVPGLILLDGDEVRDRSKAQPERGLKENRAPDQVMRMTPEIYIVLDTRTPGNLNVGDDLNTARLAILATIMTDPTLQSIVGGNGNMWLDGSVSDLSRGRSMKGQMGLSFHVSISADRRASTRGHRGKRDVNLRRGKQRDALCARRTFLSGSRWKPYDCVCPKPIGLLRDSDIFCRCSGVFGLPFMARD